MRMSPGYYSSLTYHPFVHVLCLFLLTTVRLTWAQQQQRQTQSVFPNYGCDYSTDTCPDIYQRNGICDSEQQQQNGGTTIPDGCLGGDCIDCDTICYQWDGDCIGCLQHGCSYCPGDSYCYNAPYQFISKERGNVACPNPEDYFVPPSVLLPQRNPTTSTIEQICQPPEYFFSDPLYSTQQWIFDMINVLPVWKQGYFGTGIRIRINDDGVASNHPELEPNFSVDDSCTATTTTNGDDNNNSFSYIPLEPLEENSHGTSVASIAAGSANNGICGTGIAPKASISACYGLGNDYTFLSTKLNHMDISSNSFGTDACRLDNNVYRGGHRDRHRSLQDLTCPFTYRPEPSSSSSSSSSSSEFPCDVCNFAGSGISNLAELNPTMVSANCESAISKHCYNWYEEDSVACLEVLDFYLSGGQCEYNTLSTVQREALIEGVTQGRDGKGIVYVWAAGNAYPTGEDTNFEGFLNTRFTISVGAVGKDGYHASYSTPGTALVVVAPGGDAESLTNIVTADIEGGCHDAGEGTSFSCPIVAGVIALILEVNPNLSWRDVQGILARTSRMVLDDPDDKTRVTNAAGITHSNFYGFGIINAAAAVEAATSWPLFGPEQIVVGRSGFINLPIVDDITQTTTSTISILTTVVDVVGDDTSISRGSAGGQEEDSTTINKLQDDDKNNNKFFITESVVVYLDVSHFSRGDLDVVLTSPHGTKSVLHPGNRPETSQIDGDKEEEHWKLMTVRSWGELAKGDWTLDITDISAGDVDTCVNHVWEIIDRGDTLSCSYFERQGYCVDGRVDQYELEYFNEEYLISIRNNDGLNFVAACCECGGGKIRDDSTSNTHSGGGINRYVDELVQWRIVVYGRWVDQDGLSVYNNGNNNNDGGTSNGGESSVARGGGFGGDYLSIPTLLWSLTVACTFYAWL